MRKVKVILRIMMLILNIFIMSFSSNVNASAAEDEIISSSESMDINDYRKSRENTLTRKFNMERSLVKSISPKEEIIKVIKHGLDNLETSINLDAYIKYFKYDRMIPMNYFFETLNKYPEIFYTKLRVSCTYSCNKSTNEILSYNLNITYQYNNSTIHNMKSEFSEKVNYIKSNYLSSAKSNLEKEYIIHDYIINNCKYDYENINNLPTIDHTSYGSLVNGVAVCDGYSKGAKVLFDLCNIESGIVDSEAMNHAWNYICINGEYYNLDITWDDTDIDNYIKYSYFNISNNGMSKGKNPHRWNKSDYPSCINEKFDFLRDENLYIRNKAQLYTMIKVDGIDEFYISDLDGSNGWIKFREDLNDDGIVDIKDMAIIANNYNKVNGQAGFNRRCDLNYDGIVDIYDIAKVSYRIRS